MSNDFKLENEIENPAETYEFLPPPEPKWEMRLVKGDDGMVFHVPEAPNAFYRWMQKICLGIHWARK